MTTIKVTELERTYKNNGQHMEQCVRFTLTGQIEKADNRKASEYADVLNIQVKSSKATICNGNDLEAYLNMDAAEKYIYITLSYVAYLMDKIEYLAFCKEFSYLTRESEKNGGKEKIRLREESKKMVKWLESKI